LGDERHLKVKKEITEIHPVEYIQNNVRFISISASICWRKKIKHVFSQILNFFVKNSGPSIKKL
jgi:hypothetical protein